MYEHSSRAQMCSDLTSLNSCSGVIWQKYSSEQTNIINGFLSLALLETHSLALSVGSQCLLMTQTFLSSGEECTATFGLIHFRIK